MRLALGNSQLVPLAHTKLVHAKDNKTSILYIEHDAEHTNHIGMQKKAFYDCLPVSHSPVLTSVEYNNLFNSALEVNRTICATETIHEVGRSLDSAWSRQQSFVCNLDLNYMHDELQQLNFKILNNLVAANGDLLGDEELASVLPFCISTLSFQGILSPLKVAINRTPNKLHGLSIIDLSDAATGSELLLRDVPKKQVADADTRTALRFPADPAKHLHGFTIFDSTVDTPIRSTVPIAHVQVKDFSLLSAAIHKLYRVHTLKPQLCLAAERTKSKVSAVSNVTSKHKDKSRKKIMATSKID